MITSMHTISEIKSNIKQDKTTANLLTVHVDDETTNIDLLIQSSKLRKINHFIYISAAYVTFTSDTSFRIQPCYHNNNVYANTLEYSYDLYNWYRIATLETTMDSRRECIKNPNYNPSSVESEWNKRYINSEDGAYALYMRGTLNYGGLFRVKSQVQSWKFPGATNLKVSGNLATLLNYQLPVNTLSKVAFHRMFYQCLQLVDASELELHSTIVDEEAYAQMFSGCKNLKSAPHIIPAKQFGEKACSEMFLGCEAMDEPPHRIGLKDTIFVGKSSFEYMFSHCEAITFIPYMAPETLGERTCAGMFFHCGSLVDLGIVAGMDTNNQPIFQNELPATKVGAICYYSMFGECEKLETAPPMKVTTFGISSCYMMYQNCVKLISPGTLPATTLEEGCYAAMYFHCTSLKNPPELPAITLPQPHGYEGYGDDDPLAEGHNLFMGVYVSMFSECTAMENPPELPATDISLSISCYKMMFSGCTSLKKAPVLPAEQIPHGCYQYMFNGCTALTNVPNITASSFIDDGHWVWPPSPTWPSFPSYYRMFAGCTALVHAPEMPILVLAPRHCREMFLNCTSLQTIPDLPATDLKAGCYEMMFSGCTSLTINETSGSSTPQPWRIPAVGYATNVEGAATNSMLSGSIGTAPSSPSINMAPAPGEAEELHIYYQPSKT